MYYSLTYPSPIENLLLVSNETHIIGIWMEGEKYFCQGLTEEPVEKPELPVLQATADWLNRYFAGEKPEISEVPLAPNGSDFRQEVWRILCEIPYGQTTTYGAIAKEMAARLGKKTMSAQAVGGAVGHNPVAIIIPCHRVVGTNGSLTGYAGGIDKKIKLLEHEGADMSDLFVPAKSTAP